MDKALHYLSLARKAGLAELGEEPVNAVTRRGKGYLVAVAADASDHTWRRAQSFVAGTDQQCVRLDASKADMGQAVGRTELAIAALTDPALALALVESLDRPERFQAQAQVLRDKAQRLQRRRKEAQAHLRNRRRGRPERKKEH